MAMRQWSLGPQASTSLRAVTVTRSAIAVEAKTKSSWRVAPAGRCRLVVGRDVPRVVWELCRPRVSLPAAGCLGADEP